VFACSFFALRVRHPGRSRVTGTSARNPEPIATMVRKRPRDVHPHAAGPEPSTIAVLVDDLRPFCHQIRAAR
jgi:hypothetical protein